MANTITDSWSYHLQLSTRRSGHPHRQQIVAKGCRQCIAKTKNGGSYSTADTRSKSNLNIVDISHTQDMIWQAGASQKRVRLQTHGLTVCPYLPIGPSAGASQKGVRLQTHGLTIYPYLHIGPSPQATTNSQGLPTIYCKNKARCHYHCLATYVFDLQFTRYARHVCRRMAAMHVLCYAMLCYPRLAYVSGLS